MKNLFLLIVVGLNLVLFSCHTNKPIQLSTDPDEAKNIAKEAYIFSYPLLMGYQAQYFTTMAGSPGYRGPLNEITNDTVPADHRRKDVVSMNGDTPYSAFGIDLRAEPLVLSVPEMKDRYYVFQCIDLFTHNFAFIGTRATGTEAGDYLFVGPGFEGEIPEGKFKKVFHSESQFVTIVGRTQLKGKADLPNVVAVQNKYKLRPLSEFTGEKPMSAPEPNWIPLNPEEFADARFIKYANFYLSMIEPFHPQDTSALNRFEKIGMVSGATFDSANYQPEVLTAITEGIKEAQMEIKNKAENIAERVNGWNMLNAFGPREFYNGDWLLRAAAVMVGIYGNDMVEAFYPVAYVDMDDEVLDGSKHHYKIEFTKDEIPPAKYFWSITLYNKHADGVGGYMSENEINRYLINSSTEGLKYDQDGGFRVYVQHETPTKEDEKSNWLPAPDEPFYLMLRVYGPETSALEGSWEPPGIVKND
ncbi:DUF1254 domain-containing protein [Algoriphagus sp. NG3]|uniref:DUF1254 domain-containing protein n=1 Tax=Algoriphagus sp. NG3 TaxID=3097546 RepID=UPI002A841273|nr:DUF1254 domain-containing protein [Algoriphagus sp. NG3]WPR77666.1 DUF1254 domain-containing protein [Algoriphagus sp. NG3]